MSTGIDELRRQARQEYERMRRVEEGTFETGVISVLGCDAFPVVVSPEPDRDRPGLHMIVVGVHGQVPRVAQLLACGVLDESGDIVAVRRTNRRGVLWCRLEGGSYRLRFVDDVREPIDVEILERLGDDLAIEHLEAVWECEALPEGLRERVRVARPVSWFRRKVWTAPMQALQAAHSAEGFPIAVRMKWESPDGNLMAVLNLPQEKSASGQTSLVVQLYENHPREPRRQSSGFRPAHATLAGVEAKEIEAGRLTFVWEELEGEPQLIVDGNEWNPMTDR